MPFNLVYVADEGPDDPIVKCMNRIQNVMEVYHLPLVIRSLDSWLAIMENTTDPVIYVASAGSEMFHRTVRKQFVVDYEKLHKKRDKNMDINGRNSYIVLVCTPEAERPLQRVLKHMKDQLKKSGIEKEAVDTIVTRIHIITDIEIISFWWPRIIRVVCYKRAPAKPRQIGVYFKIDSNDIEQMEWIDEQKTVLEERFRLSCRYNDGVFPEEKYIQNSTCVVMYVHGNKNNFPTRRRSQGSIVDVNNQSTNEIEQIQDTVKLCQRHGTRFQLYVDNAEGSICTKLDQNNEMTLVGADGMMSYWIGLLNFLDIGKYFLQPFYHKTKKKMLRKKVFSIFLVSSFNNRLH